MKKGVTALVLAACLVPAIAYGQSAGSGTEPGGAAGGTLSGRSGTGNLPADCAPDDARPACQQAAVPERSENDGTGDRQGDAPSAGSRWNQGTGSGMGSGNGTGGSPSGSGDGR